MINWQRVKDDEIYKVEWLDIATHTNEKLKKPYNQFLAPSVTIGKIRRDKDTLIIIYGWNNDEECYDAIPLRVITNITKIV